MMRVNGETVADWTIAPLPGELTRSPRVAKSFLARLPSRRRRAIGVKIVSVSDRVYKVI